MSHFEKKKIFSKKPMGWILALSTLSLIILMFQNFSTPQILSPLEQSIKIYRRLTGTTIPLDDPRLRQMEELIAKGDAMSAAKIATEQIGFYDITLKQFASEMSTRDKSAIAPLNDLSATVIGIVRDDLDARLMVSGNFLYAPRGATPNELLTSNTSYENLYNSGASLKDSLIKVDGQKVRNGQGQIVNHPDPAGVITSRAYMAAHAIAGTNRRLVEYALESFLCTPLADAADTSAPDTYVGPEVSRVPDGSNMVFQQKCKGCHGAMDAMRPAFAYFTFEAGQVKYATLYPSAPQNQDTENTSNLRKDSKNGKVPFKFTRSMDVFPKGYVVSNDEWINYFSLKKGQQMFGWRGDVKGKGLNALGVMFGNSKGFSQCMVKRTFKHVCKRSPNSAENYLVSSLAESFEKENYNLKWLFQKVALRSECLGL